MSDAARYTITFPADATHPLEQWNADTRHHPNASVAWWIPVATFVERGVDMGAEGDEALGVRFLAVTAHNMSEWATVIYDTEANGFLEEMGTVDGKPLPWPTPMATSAPVALPCTCRTCPQHGEPNLGRAFAQGSA